MRRAIALLIIAAALSGCATKEGISLGTTRPSRDEVADFNKRNPDAPRQTPSASRLPGDIVKTAQVPEDDGAKIIIIGTVMALTVFDDDALTQRYEKYAKQMEASSRQTAFTKEWYLATGAGETAVKFSGVTGIYSRFFKAEVPKDLVRQISFASAFGSFMAGTSGDLVVAQRTGKTGTWVTHILCSEKDPNAGLCEAKYQKGVYQGVDGREIDGKLQLVDGGATIDTVTFAKK